jgi:ATP-dependent Clp protease ATP-binding subunit ClpA
MFDQFSERSLRVMFATRVEAGKRGAEAIDVSDLVAGIIAEDQNDFSSLLLGERKVENAQVMYIEPHKPFFAPELAVDLLTDIEGLVSRASPVATEADLPVTPELGDVFVSAEDLRKQTHHKQLEPLHLLGAVLQQRDHPATELLRNVGITEEMVLEELRNGEH